MRLVAAVTPLLVLAACTTPSPPPARAPTPAPLECATGRVGRGGACVAIDDDCRPGETLEFGVGCVRGGAETTRVKPAETAALPAAAPDLAVEDLVTGTGTVARPGMTLAVHYTGALPDGSVFDTSRARKEPFRFALGAGTVITGWDKGLVGMRVGGRRKLVLGPAMAYGERGVPPKIPPRATLVFDIELLAAVP